MAVIAPERGVRAGYAGFREMCERIGFNLEPFQRKIAKAAFGPERELLVLLPRGGGKSRLIGTLAVHHLLTVENPAVYIAAAARDQARIVFEYSLAAAQALDVDELIVRHLELRVPGGYLRVLASDAPKLHGLTPSLAIVDELQAHRDDTVYIAMRTSMLKRPDAQMWVLSTAGASPLDPLGKLRGRAMGAPDVRTRGALTDARSPSLRMLEWRVPDEVSIGDTRWAKKANPGSWVTPAALREQREAVDAFSFQRYHLNRWVGKIGSWLPPGAWQACAGETRIEDNEPLWVGVDIGGSEADSAVVWCNRSLHIGVEVFEGEAAILDVRDLVPELCQRYEVKAVMFDPWHAGEMLHDFEQRKIPVFHFSQGDHMMFPAYRTLYRAIVQKRLVHPDDPKLNEHVHNAVAKHSRRGWRLIAGGGNIDAAVAMCLAVSKARTYEEPTAPQIVWA
jgi:phage terminase large subunit-like protein